MWETVIFRRLRINYLGDGHVIPIVTPTYSIKYLETVKDLHWISFSFYVLSIGSKILTLSCLSLPVMMRMFVK